MNTGSRPAAAGETSPGKRALLVMAAGLAVIIAGYALLKKVDPAGQNLYAVLAPIALLAGYLLIPAALFARAKTVSKNEPQKTNLPE